MWAPVAGKYGRTRDGQRVGPLQDTGGDDWPFVSVGTDALCWSRKGLIWAAPNDPLDLVAEWVEDGPVRTVTRREVVPGTYGRVVVGDFVGSLPIVYLINRNGKPHDSGYPALMTADELDAAAAVLTALAEALRDGQ